MNVKSLLRVIYQSGLVAMIVFATILYATRDLVGDRFEFARGCASNFFQNAASDERPPVESNLCVPLDDLQLVGLTGTNRPLSLDDLRGKVVLLNFWGTWCPPCRAEFPAIESLARHYRRDRDVRVLAVSCSTGQTENLAQLKQQTQAFLTQQRTTLPTLADPEGKTRQAIDRAVGFRAIPRRFCSIATRKYARFGSALRAERLFASHRESTQLSDRCCRANRPVGHGRPFAEFEERATACRPHRFRPSHHAQPFCEAVPASGRTVRPVALAQANKGAP